MQIFLFALLAMVATVQAGFILCDGRTGKELVDLVHRDSYNLADLGLGKDPFVSFKYKTRNQQGEKSALVKFKGRNECQSKSPNTNASKKAPPPTNALDLSKLGPLGRVKLVAQVFPNPQCRGDQLKIEIARVDFYYDATEAPSPFPTISSVPSASPTLSSEPTTSVMPTSSSQPSSAPTSSFQPTSSTMPSSVPSSLPTAFPTVSAMPTMLPASKVWLNEIHTVSRAGEVNEGIEYAMTADADPSNYYVFHYDIAADELVFSAQLDMFPNVVDDGSGIKLVYADDGGSAEDEMLNAPAAYGIFDIEGNTVVELVVMGTDHFDKEGTVLEIFEWDYVIYLKGEDGTDRAGMSLQRRGKGCLSGDFKFRGPAVSSFGLVNAGQNFAC